MTAQSFLLRAWLVFSTFTTVLSLASLSEDVIAWWGFIVDLVRAYRSLVDGLWGGLFGAFSLDLPRWTHDYLTLTSLMSTSILWALSRAGEQLHIGARSLWAVLRDTTLEFTVGGDALEHFTDRAHERLPAPMRPEAEAVVKHVARSTKTTGLVLDGLLAAAVLLACAILMPLLALPFLAYRDRLAHRRALKMFAARRAEIEQAGLEEQERDILVDAMVGQAKGHESFPALARLYHQAIRRQLVLYYAAVASIFLGLVLLNVLGQKISVALATAGAAKPS
ncbi:hypothetical protein [Brevundimonas sp. GCM10030266]|uniref:hypothetical protein n=1 Tax=Brevundimonas sp. GCM10030266 TaxID=3273386 RepID=UPI00361A8E9B